MSKLGKEWEVKLNLLRSITRSQEALARILESVADVSANSETSAAEFREHIRVLSNMQKALLGAVTGMGWQSPKEGVPSPPWLAKQVATLYNGMSAREAERGE
ncbi:hypothetical protein [Cohnella thailandensis]|jgi:hypothetical protein|uniref:Uncharacterized protein n=1 Tax=Cohnella thailandensis TaxID=557557 RepID=A0A841T1U2_9BACL|nr:hypothetical protein [Cohnella thailandensis]MBB6635847.1 hypothetical protein [Cohnella thailandensis]MBP1976225.1 hypothetical protein [Cohnella thailandensis]